MTYDDNVQTAAMGQTARSPASIGATCRAPVRCEASFLSSNAGRAKRGIGVTTETKFSCLQSLENSQNGERISTFVSRFRERRIRSIGAMALVFSANMETLPRDPAD
jgi:hypothetical protein